MKYVIGDRWGVSESEMLRTYPCDDFATSPTLQAWRGVRIQAPAEVVAVGYPKCGLRHTPTTGSTTLAAAHPGNWRAYRSLKSATGSPLLLSVNWA